jgi:hypothetical protein
MRRPLSRQKARFETVPLADVPQAAMTGEVEAVEKIADKNEPYAVQIERRQSSLDMNSSFRRPMERRR